MATQAAADAGIDVKECPVCRGTLEAGFVNAPHVGVLWTTDPTVKWFSILSRKVKKLQKDWFGFRKLAKDKMPGLRCPRCRLVVFRYTNDRV